jgi:hypothetical protein
MVSLQRPGDKAYPYITHCGDTHAAVGARDGPGIPRFWDGDFLWVTNPDTM